MDLERERAKSERLLRNVFPEAVGRRLRAGDAVVAERFGDASVLFCTIVGVERMAAELAPEAFLARLHGVFARMERCSAELGAEKIKTTGATFIAVAGLPAYRPDHAELLVGLGLRLQEFAAEVGIMLRVGVNSGPVVAGVIGESRPTYDIWGDTVNTAQRMDLHAGEGEVLVSPLTFAKVNHRFECEAREGVSVKGKGAMKTYVVRGARGGRA
jgi:adenylate cyclase